MTSTSASVMRLEWCSSPSVKANPRLAVIPPTISTGGQVVNANVGRMNDNEKLEDTVPVEDDPGKYGHKNFPVAGDRPPQGDHQDPYPRKA